MAKNYDFCKREFPDCGSNYRTICEFCEALANLPERIAIFIETEGRGKCVSNVSTKALADEIRKFS